MNVPRVGLRWRGSGNTGGALCDLPVELRAVSTSQGVIRACDRRHAQNPVGSGSFVSQGDDSYCRENNSRKNSPGASGSLLRLARRSHFMWAAGFWRSDFAFCFI